MGIVGALLRSKSDLRFQWFVRTLVALPSEPLRAILHGRNSAGLPCRHDRLYVRPASIERRVSYRAVHVGRIGDVLGRVIIPGDWDLSARSLGRGRKRLALIGLAQGLGPFASDYVAWMERQAAKSGHNHGCRTREDIERRAAKLEAMIEELRSTQRLRERREFLPWTFRERDGIQVAVGRDGEVLHASDGDHRLTFCQTLDLDAIPVSVIAVHPEALRNGAWARLVTESRSLAHRVQEDAGRR